MLFFVGSNCENQRDDRGLTFFLGGGCWNESFDAGSQRRRYVSGTFMSRVIKTILPSGIAKEVTKQFLISALIT